MDAKTVLNARALKLMAAYHRNSLPFHHRASGSQENGHRHQGMKRGLSGFLPTTHRDLRPMLYHCYRFSQDCKFDAKLWLNGIVLESGLAEGSPRPVSSMG